MPLPDRRIVSIVSLFVKHVEFHLLFPSKYFYNSVSLFIFIIFSLVLAFDTNILIEQIYSASVVCYKHMFLY